MMICCVNFGIPFWYESLPAKKHSTGVYWPMRCTTLRIWIASSREGAMQIAYESRAGFSVLS